MTFKKNDDKAKNEYVDLGIKKISKLNFLKIIILPKIFTDFLDEDMYVYMELDGETLMITPALTSDLTDGE